MAASGAGPFFYSCLDESDIAVPWLQASRHRITFPEAVEETSYELWSLGNQAKKIFLSVWHYCVQWGQRDIECRSKASRPSFRRSNRSAQRSVSATKASAVVQVGAGGICFIWPD